MPRTIFVTRVDLVKDGGESLREMSWCKFSGLDFEEGLDLNDFPAEGLGEATSPAYTSFLRVLTEAEASFLGITVLGKVTSVSPIGP